MLKDIRAGKGTVGKLFTDDALYREINDFVDVRASRRGLPARRARARSACSRTIRLRTAS